MQCKIHTPATITDPSCNVREKRLEIYTPPLPPKSRMEKMARFALCASLNDLDLGDGGLLFHSILSKIVVEITLRWVVRRKNLYRSMSTNSKQKQDDKNRLL